VILVAAIYADNEASKRVFLSRDFKQVASVVSRRTGKPVTIWQRILSNPSHQGTTHLVRSTLDGVVQFPK
jgi:hypothetical protein